MQSLSRFCWLCFLGRPVSPHGQYMICAVIRRSASGDHSPMGAPAIFSQNLAYSSAAIFAACSMSAWLKALLTNFSPPMRICCSTLVPYSIEENIYCLPRYSPWVTWPGSDGPIAQRIPRISIDTRCPAVSWSWVETSLPRLADGLCNVPSALQWCSYVILADAPYRLSADYACRIADR